MNNPIDELKWIQELRAGKDAAFKKIYLENYQNIERHILKNNGRVEDAEDLFQEALIVLVKRLRDPAFELQVKPGTYLSSIVNKMWLYKLRDKKEFSRDMQEHPLDSKDFEYSVDSVNLDARLSIVERILETFKDECKSLLSQFYFEHKSLLEISRVLGYTSDFVKVKKSRCMNALRKQLLENRDFLNLQN
ncbi:MAG: sigma-70 family RNA polymerase sigma factor [Saprospiraceae bacterium]|nr:sigma-70 family RNA polymerase sigma factor [Saprospiraceae bacterium]MBK8449160.1 sigma-70 family RNA polymerase sigma factor [Saprospiraceae bacterium]MBK8484789.1 sigma-70 family RNA polymerase sigma factor [Saprospiraceae bacterium]MBK9222181.1 sigma-70 family RNA polymerase sigma factor [Saprospiraceae bacterium]MBK9720909.1 sigma-70 family RNA polymerase sigma factor [Saprospiraceae bacterium]